MSLRSYEKWQPQANQWNGITPEGTPFGERFDLSETPPMEPDAQVALGASEQILSWREGRDDQSGRFPVDTRRPAPGGDFLD
jgi:hypothetical protein